MSKNHRPPLFAKFFSNYILCLKKILPLLALALCLGWAAPLYGQTLYWNGTTIVADGTVHGGAGTWDVGITSNWLTPDFNTAIPFTNQAGNVLVFDGTSGTVTSNGAKDFDTLRFNVGG